MFLKNEILFLFVKFLWVGLVFGVIAIVLKNICKIFKKNIVLVNELVFVFWLTFGIIYEILCINYNNFAFSGVGLAGMLAGVLIIKISIDFFFDYFICFIYNEINLRKGRIKNGQLQTNKKI